MNQKIDSRPQVVAKRKVIIQTDLEGNVVRKYASLNEASNISGCNKSNIRMVCQGKRNQTGGFKWMYCNTEIQPRGYLNRPVLQYTLDGKYLNRFESTYQAASEVKVHRGNVTFCCQGKNTSAGGFMWKYLSENYKEGVDIKGCRKLTLNQIPSVKLKPGRPTSSKRLVQYGTDGKIINIYTTIGIAREQMGVSKNALFTAAKGIGVTCKGYYWKYEGDFERLYKVTPEIGLSVEISHPIYSEDMIIKSHQKVNEPFTENYETGTVKINGDSLNKKENFFRKLFKLFAF